MSRQLSAAEIDAFYTYGQALYDGVAKPPEGIEVDGNLEEALSQMVKMHLVLRVPDHNSVADVVAAMVVIDPIFIEAALDYTPTARTLM